MPNFSFLACLEVAEKFVVVVGWSRPSLGFSFSQAEQLWNNDNDNCETSWGGSGPTSVPALFDKTHQLANQPCFNAIKIKPNLL